MDRHRAAWAVLEVATANMYAQLTPLLAKHGVDPREYAFLAYGGAGPTHIFLLLREVGIPRVVVPPLPGALCALGCLVADLRADFVGSMQRELTRLPAAELEAAFQALEAQARGWVAREGLPIGRRELVRSAEMRFKGQSFEINVPLPDGPIGDLGPVLAAFHRAYQQHTIRGPDGAPSWWTSASRSWGRSAPAPRRRPRWSPAAPGPGHPAPLPDGGFLGPGSTSAGLRPGDAFAGPAVVEQYDTTTLVPAGFMMRVDAWGNLIERGTGVKGGRSRRGAAQRFQAIGGDGRADPARHYTVFVGETADPAPPSSPPGARWRRPDLHRSGAHDRHAVRCGRQLSREPARRGHLPHERRPRPAGWRPTCRPLRGSRSSARPGGLLRLDLHALPDSAGGCPAPSPPPTPTSSRTGSASPW
jgi:N-methylhydantoinase A